MQGPYPIPSSSGPDSTIWSQTTSGLKFRWSFSLDPLYQYRSSSQKKVSNSVYAKSRCVSSKQRATCCPRPRALHSGRGPESRQEQQSLARHSSPLPPPFSHYLPCDPPTPHAQTRMLKRKLRKKAGNSSTLKAQRPSQPGAPFYNRVGSLTSRREPLKGTANPGSPRDSRGLAILTPFPNPNVIP